MSLRKRESEDQREFWLPTDRLATGPGHVFYDKLQRLLADHGFDLFVEQLCQPYYQTGGRPSIPPGVYFRMLMIGYLEGIDSQRGIAGRCADSLALRRFLGIRLSEQTPDHSSLTRIRDRLPLSLHEEVFRYILFVIEQHGFLTARTVGVDSTLLEANAAMKAIIRQDTGEDWKAYLKRLMREEGLIEDDEDPTDEELRKFDQSRAKQGQKKVSNEEWTSPSDPESRIVRMKDGRTHLGYKAEHVVDLDSEVILSATITAGTDGDAQTLLASVVTAQTHLDQSGCGLEIEEVAADKGYHANETLALSEELDLRTYIPEPKSRSSRRWTDKPPEQQRAVANNRCRMRRAKGKRLQRERSEKVERSFAHVCETGGSRRTWLRGLDQINKRYLIVAAARNLGLLMLKLFGIGKPRTLQSAGGGVSIAPWGLRVLRNLAWCVPQRSGPWWTALSASLTRRARTHQHPRMFLNTPNFIGFSTGC